MALLLPSRVGRCRILMLHSIGSIAIRTCYGSGRHSRGHGHQHFAHGLAMTNSFSEISALSAHPIQRIEISGIVALLVTYTNWFARWPHRLDYVARCVEIHRLLDLRRAAGKSVTKPFQVQVPCPQTSPLSRPLSIADPARLLNGRRLLKHSTITYSQHNKAVLRRPLELRVSLAITSLLGFSPGSCRRHCAGEGSWSTADSRCLHLCRGGEVYWSFRPNRSQFEPFGGSLRDHQT